MVYYHIPYFNKLFSVFYLTGKTDKQLNSSNNSCSTYRTAGINILSQKMTFWPKPTEQAFSASVLSAVSS